MNLQQLLGQSGGSSGGQSDIDWVEQREKHRALQELLQLELNKQRRESEAATGVMDLVSGYGTPGQRAEQLYAPRPQLAQALSQFGGSELGAPESGSNIPSFTDFGSPGQAFARTSSGGNIDLGMKGISRTDPESLTGINREAYRSAIGLKGPDQTEELNLKRDFAIQMDERRRAEEAAKEKRAEAVLAQHKVDEEEKAAINKAHQEAKERGTILFTAKQLYLQSVNNEEIAHRGEIGELRKAKTRALTDKDRANIQSDIDTAVAEMAARRRVRPTLRSHLNDVAKDYEALRTGKFELTQEDDKITTVKQILANLSPIDQMAITAYDISPEELIAEAAKHNWTLEKTVSSFLKQKRGGIDLNRGA